MLRHRFIVGPDGVTVVRVRRHSFSWSEILWFDFMPVGTSDWEITLVPRTGATVKVPVPHPGGTSKRIEDELWGQAVQLTVAVLGDEVAAQRALAEREGRSAGNTGADTRRASPSLITTANDDNEELSRRVEDIQTNAETPPDDESPDDGRPPSAP